MIFVETEISKFLSESKSSKLDASWLEKCKTAFCKSTDGKLDSIKGNGMKIVVYLLLNFLFPVIIVAACYLLDAEPFIFSDTRCSGKDGCCHV